jgi:hypothetical protein
MTAKNFPAEKNPPPAGEGSFSVFEGSLPARLGIPRKVISLLRQEVLEKDADWRLIDKEIRLTEASVLKLAQAFGRLKNAAPAATPPSKPSLPEEHAVIEAVARPAPITQESHPSTELEVLRLCPTNPKILFALAPGREGFVTVRVQSSAFYRPKMRLRARLVSGGLYVRAGRDPRFPGEKV